MTAALTLTCPVDGLPLGVRLDVNEAGNKTRDAHLHILVGPVTVSCANGHDWELFGDLLLTFTKGVR